PKLKTVYISEGGSNQVAVVNEDNLKIVKHIPVGNTPDGIAYDPINNKIFVSNENGGTVSVIDPGTYNSVEDISVGGSVGNTQYDSISKLIYSVSGDNNTLVEINPIRNSVVKKFNLKDCSHPHGFYIEEQTNYALI